MQVPFDLPLKIPYSIAVLSLLSKLNFTVPVLDLHLAALANAYPSARKHSNAKLQFIPLLRIFDCEGLICLIPKHCSK